MNKKYIHKKTGKPYFLITDNFMMKENGEWKRGLILYKAGYDNPDSEYFARTPEDFYENFIEVIPKKEVNDNSSYISEKGFPPCFNNNEFSIYKWTFKQPEHVIINERGRFASAPIEVYDNNGYNGYLEDYAGKMADLITVLSNKTEQEVETFLNFHLDPF